MTVVQVSDATLRDTAHMPGVDFTPRDVAVIAALLVAVGVDIVEVGIVDHRVVRDQRLLSAALETIGDRHVMTVVLARTRDQTHRDLEAVHSLGCRSVMASIPTSPLHARLKLGTENPRRILALAKGAILSAKELGLHVTVSAEDGARTDSAFLEEYIGTLVAGGADRFRLAETVSTLAPRECADLVRRLVSSAGRVEIEIHSHNMFGLAVANALAAVQAGAEWISTTVDGLGERGGNTPLAEVCCYLASFYGVSRFRLEHLTALSREVVSRCGISRGATAGPTGELSYAYEIAGQLLNTDAFEAIPAPIVGNSRKVRVRSRVTSGLLRACLPAELRDSMDLDAFASELRSQLPSEKATWSADDLVLKAEERLAGASKGCLVSPLPRHRSSS